MKSDILIASMSEPEQTQSGVENEPTVSQYRALLKIATASAVTEFLHQPADSVAIRSDYAY